MANIIYAGGGAGLSSTEILNVVYPVGSIYISVNSTNPNTLFGGAWQRVAQGRTLFGEGSLNGITYRGNTEVNAGLPNITASQKLAWDNSTGGGIIIGGNTSGAFYRSTTGESYFPNGIFPGNQPNTLNFDASRSNSIYGNSSTVQPNALVVYIWKRTA